MISAKFLMKVAFLFRRYNYYCTLMIRGRYSHFKDSHISWPFEYGGCSVDDKLSDVMISSKRFWANLDSSSLFQLLLVVNSLREVTCISKAVVLPKVSCRPHQLNHMGYIGKTVSLVPWTPHKIKLSLYRYCTI